MKATRKCVICGGKFSAKTTSPRRTDTTACSRKYLETHTRGRTARRTRRGQSRSWKCPDRAAAHLEAQRRYTASKAGREARDRYQRSAKFRAAQKKYYYSEKGRATYGRSLAKRSAK